MFGQVGLQYTAMRRNQLGKLEKMVCAVSFLVLRLAQLVGVIKMSLMAMFCV